MEKKIPVKNAIARSMLELSQNKTINKITVDMIVDNCGVSRRSFYNNFENKYDLIFYIFDLEISKIINTYYPTEPWGKVLGRICQFVYDNAKLFGYKWEAGDKERFTSFFADYIEKCYIDAYIQLHGKDAVTKEFTFMCKYNAYGVSSMITDFAQRKLKMTSEELGVFLAKAGLSQSLYKEETVHTDSSSPS